MWDAVTSPAFRRRQAPRPRGAGRHAAPRARRGRAAVRGRPGRDARGRRAPHDRRGPLQPPLLPRPARAARPAAPGGLAEVGAADLAGLRARQRVDQLERLGHLEAGEPLDAVRAQPGGVGARPGRATTTP